MFISKTKDQLFILYRWFYHFSQVSEKDYVASRNILAIYEWALMQKINLVKSSTTVNLNVSEDDRLDIQGLLRLNNA